MIVTGSAGKTGAKDLIAPVLAVDHVVRSTAEEGNQLLPMAILGLPPLRYRAREALVAAVRGLTVPFRRDYPDWLVVEVDASAPGRVVGAGEWLHPEMAVFTFVGDHPPHLEAFASLDDLIQETAALCETISSGGVLVVNADDEPLLEAVASRANGRRIVRYGFGPGMDVRARRMEPQYRGRSPRGLLLEVDAAGRDLRLSLPGVIGRPHAYAAMAAVAVGTVIGVPIEQIPEAISSAPRQPGRLRLLDGVGGSTLIDDSWNPSPVAWSEALRAIGSVECEGRKILITAGMSGVRGSIHTRLGRQAAGVADVIVSSGPWAEVIADGVRRSGADDVEVVTRDHPLEAADHVRDIVRPDDVVLVTAASTGSEFRMEHAVERLLLRPEDRRLLVRQRPWWPGG